MREEALEAVSRRVVTPASPVGDEALEAGLCVARELGLEVEVGVTGQGWDLRHYLAGDEAMRAGALTRALSVCDQVWMARGGYGSGRLVAFAGEGLRESWRGSLWGFSDGTVLLARAYAWGKEAWSAPPLVQVARLDAESRARLVAAMRFGTVAPFSGLEVMRPEVGARDGEVEGRVFVANLAVLASLCGTAFMPNLAGALLVVEDVNEPAFRVDRFFWQLVAAGALRGVVGLVAGQFTGVDERERTAIAAVLTEVGGVLGVPVVSGLPVGHGEANASLPIGRRARLLVGQRRLEVISAGGGVGDVSGGVHA